MFSRIMLTIAAAGLTALIALQNRSVVDIRFFTGYIAMPVAAIIGFSLLLGLGIGLLWRNLPRERKTKAEVPLIQADLKIRMKANITTPQEATMP